MRHQTKTLIQHIADRLTAIQNLRAQPTGSEYWIARHEDALAQLTRELPRGSGIDQGTSITIDRSTPDKVVLLVAFHHMDEHGYYDGWRDYTITVRPSFNGIALKIGGRDRNGIKEYLYELYDYALTRRYLETWDEGRQSAAYELVREDEQPQPAAQPADRPGVSLTAAQPAEGDSHA